MILTKLKYKILPKSRFSFINGKDKKAQNLIYVRLIKIA